MCSSQLATLEEEDSSRLHEVNKLTDKSHSVSDNEDKFGAMVTSKLQLMSPLQRLISQKIISEILLRGQLGMLKSSLCPVIVAGYMKSTINNGMMTNDFVSTMCSDSNDKDTGSSVDGDSDPLMFQQQVKQETDSTILESISIVKKETC